MEQSNFTKHKGIITKETAEKVYKIYPIDINCSDVPANYEFDPKEVIRMGKVSELPLEDINELFAPCLPYSNGKERYGKRTSHDMFKEISRKLGSEYGVITLTVFKKPKESIDGNIKSRNT